MIDFKKAIHLVYSSSGRGVLENYFKTNFPNDQIKIHAIYNDLTTGPLTDLTSISDYEAYLSFWKAIDEVCTENNHEQFKNENDYQPSNLSAEFNIDFPKDKCLIIWHGSEAGEKLMLYRYCHLLKDRELHEINLDDWPTNSKQDDTINCLAIQNYKNLDGVFNFVKEIDDTIRSFYAEEWERLKKDQKTNRILHDDNLISVNEDYYDQSILNNCTSEYQKAARVIGETMGQQESTIGDHYLWYRVRLLINQNLLECQGSPATIRDLEIKKK